MTQLSFNQKSSFPPLLRLTYLLQQKTDEQLSRQAGITLSQAHLLSGLSATPLPQHHLAVILGQTDSNISRQLAGMKKASLVNITKNKKDGRIREVKATAKGLRKYKLSQKLIKKELDGLHRLNGAGSRKAAEEAISNLLAGLTHDAHVKRALRK